MHGICTDGLALNKDIYVIDRFEIKYSKRPDPEQGKGQFQWVNPGAYPEDWKLLGEELILKSYPLSDDSGRRMGVKMTVCDSGGKAGVTQPTHMTLLRLAPQSDEKTSESMSWRTPQLVFSSADVCPNPVNVAAAGSTRSPF